ncbi:hypothetical protein FPCIR_2717 [Fusarium pseudocircinatum]|uniref:Heterokaryon incompatibility domain-containing protein n=1 Tax=Fusarium pseudocircinatum TaxID=56676 RepID=A0A8H5PM64_9HYPO|nr:hypothetical protein FPCIR_2717 [Fusarium pseudocircinatum]
MANRLRQDILAKTPIPQDESPLYAKLPGEVRDSIFSYVLTDHPDPTPDKKFKENTCYTRPSYLAAQSTDTRLLRTCRAIYRETWFKPFVLREHTEWATSEDRAPPPGKAPPRLRPMVAEISKSLGTGNVEIERLRIFAQMYRLEENGLQDILRTPHLAPRTITLTIRHTDWWYWEEDEPLHFEGNWIEGVSQVLTPSTTQFCIELESLERKKDQVDKIAKQMVDAWFFKRPDGVVLYADTSDANRKVSRWSGSSTWHGQRWTRDETEPNKLDYYIVSITFGPLISIERSGGSVSERAIKEAQDPHGLGRPKLLLPDNQERIETEYPYDDGYSGMPQPESDNDEWYAEMEEIYGNGRFMQGLHQWSCLIIFLDVSFQASSALAQKSHGAAEIPTNHQLKHSQNQAVHVCLTPLRNYRKDGPSCRASIHLPFRQALNRWSSRLSGSRTTTKLLQPEPSITISKPLYALLFDDASAYPPYAILSHCWYSSELELTFKDFEDLSQHTSKPGYSKIVSACHAAVAQGYEWLWVDSVCINEENAVEKEETMKKTYSMFLNAGVCLLYLSEIPNANIKDDDKEILSSDIRKSRWMSQAWTYKELIPPQKSVFYAADWSRLDPEFQADIKTNILGVNQYDGSKEERKHSHFPSHPPRVRSSRRQSRPVYRPAAAAEEQSHAAENPTPTTTPTPSPPPAVIEHQRRSYVSQSKQPSITTDGSTPRNSGPTGTGPLSSLPSFNSAQSVDDEGPSVFENYNQPSRKPYRKKIENAFFRLSNMIGTPAQDLITEPKVKRADNVDLPMMPGEEHRNPMSGVSAVGIERDRQERATLFNSGWNLIINQSSPDISESISSFAYRGGLSGDDDVKRGSSYPQTISQRGIRILILDNDHAVGNTLSWLLKSHITAQVTVDSGYVVNLKGSGYDIVFARGEGSPLLYMPPNYSHRGAARILKKCLTMPPPPSSIPATVSFEIHGEYQVICESQKQGYLTDLTSSVLRVEKVYENGFALMFGVTFSDGSVRWPQMSFSDLASHDASHNSLQEPVTQDQLLVHQTIDLTTSGLFDDQQAIDHPLNAYLRPTKEGGPADSYPLEPGSINTQSPHECGSVQSEAITNSPCSSTFDLTVQSNETRPSTVPASLPHKPQNPKGALDSLQTTECQAEEEGSISSSHHRGEQNQWSPGKSENNRAGCDTATTYSLDTLSDDPKFVYFQAFIDQLAEDVRAAADGTILQNVGQGFLDQTLRDFAWKLHEESTNPFQLETSVIIHRKRRNIVDLLDFQVPALEEAESMSGQSLVDSEAENGEEASTVPFEKAEEMIVDWIDDVKSGEPNDLSQMPQYRQFIQGSEAYQWLLTKISQQTRLSCEEPSLMDRIGNTIRNTLKESIPHHKMSRKKASIGFEMTYSVTLDVIGMMKRSGISSSFDKALPNILCLTGKRDEAQATSVAEYMDQAWPHSGGAIISLLQDLLSDQESFLSRFDPVPLKTLHSGTWTEPPWPETTRGNYSTHCILTGTMKEGRDTNVRYEISAKGGYYAVSEVGEQIAWLASVFQKNNGFSSIEPCVTDFSARDFKNNSGSTISIKGNGSFSFSVRPETAYNPSQGFCWERLFGTLNIVRGYPILRRSVPKSGLEVSLPYAASIVGSSEVVQWDKRLVVKGFNMLMVATQVTADVMVWHLLVSEKPEERISYVDPRLDHIDIRTSDEMSLRHIEGKRHIVGWCTKATDHCGHPTANHEIKPGGLPKVSASIVVDKLYIEGGSPVTAGLMLDINKKAQPFWLQREMDYPSLLNWVKLQPIVFYDVEERRAWLVDGASALLHLVRISLHLDINDPESAYDWVYDPSKLKDHWPGVGSRQAALQTLKNWENRALNVYIVDKHMDSNGVPVTKYSTFGERVKRILHSIEKLIDRQAQAASQDGLKISQTLDPRRDVVGFDIVDIINPAVPIYPRIQHLNSWGHGWIDLIPTVGITALFGRGFGDLIRADEPGLICPSWRSVPVGKDYLAASISTMQMLHEKRLLRMEPGLVGGKLTKKITWVASKEASLHCRCVRGQGNNDVQTAEAECNHNPVQFLAKRWWSRTIPHGLKPVQLGTLDPRGAVIFGHTVLGLRTGDRSKSRQADDDGASSMTSGEQAQDASATGSIVSQTTSITVPSVGHSIQDARSAQESLDGTSNATGEGKKKRWSKFKNWVKR